jgi:hypothetical protein
MLALLASLSSQKALKVCHLAVKLEPGHFRHLDQFDDV